MSYSRVLYVVPTYSACSYLQVTIWNFTLCYFRCSFTTKKDMF